MKFVRNLILVFILILPIESKAEFFPLFSELRDTTNSEKPLPFFAYFIPLPFNITIGGGSNMFSVGTDMLFAAPLSVIYENETTRPDSVAGPWMPNHILAWTNRFRMIYDYSNHQYGFFFQPHLRYLYKWMLADIAVGPEIGWQTKTGFEWGASIRLNSLLTLCLADLEFGYFANTKKYYFNVLFDLSVKLLMD